MKVILVVLSGNSQAQQRLQELFPEASIETIPRAVIENGSFMTRLRRLRGHAPDIFAVATERLNWQRGQNLFMLFGAMAGAREVLLIDAHGGLRREPGTPLLWKGPGRLARESIFSAKVMARARRELATLERNVQNYSPSRVVAKNDDQSQPRIVYLRATPGPGTQAGGASSHIKGVVDGLIKLQAQVEIISNDALAGLG